ncbi:MAG: hypothetical protein QM654_14005 [Dysgonamonadaceae bacterium]
MKTTEFTPISTAQIKLIHVLLRQQGLMEEKENLIHSFSGGRTTSSRELSQVEAKQLINTLKGATDEPEKRKKIYNTIYALAYEMDIIYGDSEEDVQMNMAKLNVFCRERGTVKKNLSAQSHEEMKRTLRQFRAIYGKYEKAKA